MQQEFFLTAIVFSQQQCHGGSHGCVCLFLGLLLVSTEGDPDCNLLLEDSLNAAPERCWMQSCFLCASKSLFCVCVISFLQFGLCVCVGGKRKTWRSLSVHLSRCTLLNVDSHNLRSTTSKAILPNIYELVTVCLMMMNSPRPQTQR
jgi:hypothetical protein